MARDFGERLNVNLRQSVGAARTLTFASAGISNQLGGAAAAAGLMAENIARASRNARIAASASGIGAVVAILATAVAFTISWREKTKEVAQRVADVQRETARLNAQAAGDKRLERELDISDTLEKELADAKKLDGIFRKFPQLQDAIRAKAEAARRAVANETARSFADTAFDTRTETGLIFARLGGTQTDRERRLRTRQAQADRQRALMELERNQQGFSDLMVEQQRRDISNKFDAEMRLLEQDLAEMAQRVGDTFTESLANAIADGITRAISSGNIGDGLRALTGGMLIGLGQLMQTIGTEALVAAKLFSAVVSALRSFAPEGAIGPALALIAGGAILQGLGQSMGGRSSGSGLRGGDARGGSGTIIYRGLVNPANGTVTSAGMIQPRQSVVFAPTIIGQRDPVAQREITEMVLIGLARAGIKVA